MEILAGMPAEPDDLKWGISEIIDKHMEQKVKIAASQYEATFKHKAA